MEQHFGGDARVAEGAVAIDRRNPEVTGERVQRAPAQRRQETARQAQGAEEVAGDRFAEDLAPRSVEKSAIEARIVRHHHVLARELRILRQHRLDRRPSRQHLVANAGQAGDETRQRPARIDQRLKAVDHLPARDFHRADLDDRVSAPRTATGGFQVDDHEGRLFERFGEALVHARTPPLQLDIEGETLVIAEQRRKEARSELGIRPRPGENQIDQLPHRGAGRSVQQIVV